MATATFNADLIGDTDTALAELTHHTTAAAAIVARGRLIQMATAIQHRLIAITGTVRLAAIAATTAASTTSAETSTVVIATTSASAAASDASAASASFPITTTASSIAAACKRCRHRAAP